MSTVTVFPSELAGTVTGISSKSYLHRLLMCAALSGTATDISFRGLSNDVQASISAVSALGAAVTAADGLLQVRPAPRAAAIDVGESGSTFRFILPLLAAHTAEETVITGSDYLAGRPISPLYEELIAHGAAISEKGRFPLSVAGPLMGGTYRIPGNISSQFVTGLLLALPLCAEDSEIIVDGPLQSKPYVDITIECLAQFGVGVEEIAGGYRIRGGQRYSSPGRIACEADHSNAAFFLAAGALSDVGVGVSGLKLPSAQGDSAAIRILQAAGAQCIPQGAATLFRRGELIAQDIDATDIPDLVPILSLVAAMSTGTSRIYGAERLRYKESDRLHTVATLLNALGAQVEEQADGLIITGRPQLKGGVTVSSYNDHRIAMTAAIAACFAAEPVTITDFQAVNKSYPDFLTDLAAIGGIYRKEVE